jgi:putative ABC transport system permease protein
VGERFKHDYPDIYRPASGFQARTANVLAQLTGGARELLLILFGATGLVLLIACANVANLTLARMLRRDRELAMRTALGAGRWRLVRQLLTESTLLALAGGIIGFLFAWSTIGMLTAFVARFTSRTGEITIDPGVLGFTVAVSLLTGLVFGTLPALSSRVDLVGTLKSCGKGASDGSGGRRVQSALIVAQVAVSAVLLVGASLLLLSFYRLQSVDAGFRADRVLSAEVFGNFTRYGDPQALRRLYVSILERLEGAPGVLSAAVTNAVPLAGLQPGQTRFQIQGHTYDNPEQRPTADVRVASPKYFDTLGIPLRSGRVFTELDHENAAQVAIVNESMVRHWDGRDPIGAEVSFDNGERWVRVVGVVGDVKAFGLDRDAVAQVYRPLRQSGGLAGRLLVRMRGEPQGATTVIRDAVHGVDPNLPIENVRSLDEIRDRYLARPRLTAMLLAVFAAVALLVTIAGITGVIATSVSQRTREFGIRMALGASQPTVLKMVLRQGIVLVVLGLAIGIGAALVLSRVLQTYLYQTAPTDPLTFAGVAVAFLTAGTFACLGPAWRATTVDPMTALRAD